MTDPKAGPECHSPDSTARPENVPETPGPNPVVVMTAKFKIDFQTPPLWGQLQPTWKRKYCPCWKRKPSSLLFGEMVRNAGCGLAARGFRKLDNSSYMVRVVVACAFYYTALVQDVTSVPSALD